jgi:hypothetical protein
MAGAALAMIHGRDTADLDALLGRTSAAQATSNASGTAPVPRSFREVAEALARQRTILEDGGTFPAALLDRLIERLRS